MNRLSATYIYLECRLIGTHLQELKRIPSENLPQIPNWTANFIHQNLCMPHVISLYLWTILAKINSVNNVFNIIFPIYHSHWLQCIYNFCNDFSISFPFFRDSIYKGNHKCREQWPDSAVEYERAFNLFLDAILLIFPLIMLSTAYFSITKTLWQGMALERSTKRYTKSNNGNNSYQNACK